MTNKVEKGAAPKPRRGKLRKRVGIGAGVIVLLLALAVVLAPFIVSAVAPGFVSDAITDSLESGEATCESVSLSWFGTQRVGPIVVKDEQGAAVANVNIDVARGLAPLALGSRDLGVITVSGNASVERGLDGVTNIERILGVGPDEETTPPPPTPPSAGAGEIRLPAGLAGEVVLDGFTVNYRDSSLDGAGVAGGALEAIVENGRAQLDPTGARLNLKLHGEEASDSKNRLGELSADVTITNLIGSGGLVTLDAASVDATLKLTDLFVALSDAFVPVEASLAGGVGERVSATLQGSGGRDSGTASLAAKSAGLDANLALAWSDGVLRASEPGSATMKGAGWTPFLESLFSKVEGASLQLTSVPDVSATIARFEAPFAFAPGRIAADMTLEIGPSAGTVAVQGEDSTTWSLAATKITATADPEASELRLVAGTAGGAADGASSIQADVTARGLFDERSGEGVAPGRLDGAITLRSAPTLVAQPFLDASRIDVLRDIGPVIDTTINVAMDVPSLSADELTFEMLDGEASLSADSRQLMARASVAASKGTITQTGPTELELRGGKFLLDSFTRDAGVTFDRVAPIRVSLEELVADLTKRAVVGESETFDLTSVRGRARVQSDLLGGALRHERDELNGEWVIAPLDVTLDATKGAGLVKLDVESGARWRGMSAGTLKAGVVARGLVAGAGLAREPEAIEIDASLTGMSSATAQPFVEALGLQLVEDLGAGLNLSAKGTLRPVLAEQISLRESDLSVGLQAQRLSMQASAQADEQGVRVIEEGLTLTLKGAGQVASRFVPPGGVLAIRPAGILELRSTDLALPFQSGTMSPDLRAARGSVRVSLQTFGALLDLDGEGEKPPAQVSLVSGDATITLAEDSTVSLTSKLWHDGRDFAASADLTLPRALERLIAPEDDAWLPIEPLGRMEVTNLPLALASAVEVQTTQGSKSLSAVLAPAIGEVANLTLETSQASNEGLTIDTRLTASSASASLTALLNADRFRVQSAGATTTLAAEALNSLIANFVDDPDGIPQVAAPLKATVTVEPIDVPLGDGLTPEFSGVGAGRVRAEATGALSLDRFMSELPQETRDKLPKYVAFNDIVLDAKAPIGALFGGPSSAAATLSATGSLADEQGASLGTLRADASSKLGKAGPTGPIDATVQLNGITTALLDAIAGKPGMVSGALGQQARLAASTTLQLSDSEPDPFSSLDLKLEIGSPRLSLSQPLQVAARSDRFELLNATTVVLKPTKEWATRYLLGAKDAQQVAFAKPPQFELDLERLTLSRGKGTGPLKRDVFKLKGAVRSPQLELAVAPDRRERFTDLRVDVGQRANGDPTLRLELDRPGGAKALRANGFLAQLADEQGSPSIDDARLTLKVHAPEFPSPVLDALARQGGLLSVALGPTVTVNADLQNVSMQDGSIDVKANAPRASLEFAGVIENGALAASDATKATLSTVTPEFGASLAKPLPLVGAFEKGTAEAPGTIATSGLRLPIDGDLSKLSGSVVIDPGEMRFSASPVFGALLQATNRKDAGVLGRKLKPLTMNMKQGVLSYERYSLPLGEFTIETEAKEINLVEGRIDVVTWIPLGALTDEAAGRFNTGLGRSLGRAVPLFDQLTLVPWRTSGSLSNPTTRPAPDLFVQRFGATLLRPDKLLGKEIESVLEGPLGKLLKKDKDKDEEKKDEEKKDDGGGG